ncbi:hypothetical protein [Methanocaldococcus sp.]|uniref:hypothetical protein n=1 Tax=Methanocaldococcus sp. TaxID=2152917 RepID=UPI00261C4877|nr:hypothetical protein [Methanocaldococcus sp.]MCQ6254136.1 hypothetical protein [Methanocaldococcus sp.]
MYVDGKIFKTIKTFYNPIEKGMTLKKAMEINKKYKINNNVEINSKIGDIQPMYYNTIHYWWDGVYFVKGHMVKYPHPDYDYYGIEPWKYKKIKGNKLLHIHLSKEISEDIVGVPVPVAGAIIGGIIGAALGGLEGSAIGAIGGLITGILEVIVGNHLNSMFLDENDCIWIWVSYLTTYIYNPQVGWVEVPLYLRVGPYTLWDWLNVGNP